MAEIYLEIEKKVPLVVSEINLPEQSTWYIGQKAEYDIEKEEKCSTIYEIIDSGSRNSYNSESPHLTGGKMGVRIENKTTWGNA